MSITTDFVVYKVVDFLGTFESHLLLTQLCKLVYEHMRKVPIKQTGRKYMNIKKIHKMMIPKINKIINNINISISSEKYINNHIKYNIDEISFININLIIKGNTFIFPIGKPKSVKTLRIGKSCVEDISVILAYTNLELLETYICPYIKSIPLNPNIKTINLDTCEIKDIDVINLVSLPNTCLQNLTIDYCSHITDNCKLYIDINFPELSFAINTHITCPSLNGLRIRSGGYSLAYTC